MRTLLNAAFTHAGMPTVTLPAGTIPVPPAFPIAALTANAVSWFEARYGVALSGTVRTSEYGVTAWQDQIAATNDSLIVPNATPLLAVGNQNGQSVIANLNSGNVSAASQVQQLVCSTPNTVSFNYNQPFSVALAFRTPGPFGEYDFILSNVLATAGTLQGWAVSSGGTQPANLFGPSGCMGAYLINTYGSKNAIARGSTALAVDTNYIAVITFDGSGTAGGITIYLNNAAETMTVVADNLASSTTNAAGQKLAVFNEASNTYYANSVAEGAVMFGFMVFNTALTAAQATSVDQYFNGVYAIHS